MTSGTRDVPTRVTICDLCHDIIADDEHHMDRASLSHGYIAHKVTERTKRAWFRWPDLNRPGFSRTAAEEKRAREMRVDWDFHAECVYQALKATIEARWTPDHTVHTQEES